MSRTCWTEALAPDTRGVSSSPPGRAPPRGHWGCLPAADVSGKMRKCKPSRRQSHGHLEPREYTRDLPASVSAKQQGTQPAPGACGCDGTSSRAEGGDRDRKGGAMKWGELGWGGREGTHEPRRHSRQPCDLSAVPGPVCASISLLLARAADMGPQGEVPPMSPRSAAEQRAGWVPQLPPDFEQGPAPPHLQPRVRGGSNPGRQRGPLSRACRVGRGSRGQLLRSHGVWGHSEQAGPAGSWRGDHANQERRQAEEVVSGGRSRADGEGGREGQRDGTPVRPGWTAGLWVSF